MTEGGGALAWAESLTAKTSATYSDSLMVRHYFKDVDYYRIWYFFSESERLPILYIML